MTSIDQWLRGEIRLDYDRFRLVNRNRTRLRSYHLMLRWLEAQLHLARPWSYPLGLQLEPTTRCQLSCSFCPREQAVSGLAEGDMKWEYYEQLMAEIGPSLVAIAFWQWGEPLLHPRIGDMIGLAKDYGCLTLLSTNAQVGGDFDPHGLLSAGLDLLIVSMDGATEKVYQQSRQGGSLASTIGFTRRSLEARRAREQTSPIVNVRLVATSNNEHEIGKVRQVARDLGADAFSVKSVSLYYDASPENPMLPENRQWRSFQYQDAGQAAAYAALRNRCRKPWYWPFLRYDGELLLCECDHAMSVPLGNVFHEQSFRKVWRGRRAMAARKSFPGSGRIDHAFCQRCRYKIDDAIRSIDLLR